MNGPADSGMLLLSFPQAYRLFRLFAGKAMGHAASPGFRTTVMASALQLFGGELVRLALRVDRLAPFAGNLPPALGTQGSKTTGFTGLVGHSRDSGSEMEAADAGPAGILDEAGPDATATSHTSGSISSARKST